jgi:hypothetical protein
MGSIHTDGSADRHVDADAHRDDQGYQYVLMQRINNLPAGLRIHLICRAFTGFNSINTKDHVRGNRTEWCGGEPFTKMCCQCPSEKIGAAISFAKWQPIDWLLKLRRPTVI